MKIHSLILTIILLGSYSPQLFCMHDGLVSTNATDFLQGLNKSPFSKPRKNNSTKIKKRSHKIQKRKHQRKPKKKIPTDSASDSEEEYRCSLINCPRHTNKKFTRFNGKISLELSPDGKPYGGKEYFFIKNEKDATVTKIQYILEAKPSCQNFTHFSTGTKSKSKSGLRPIDGIEVTIGNQKQRMSFPELYATKSGNTYTPDLKNNTAHKVIAFKISYRLLDEQINDSESSKEDGCPNKESINKMIKLYPEATQKLHNLLSRPLESDSLLESVD